MNQSLLHDIERLRLQALDIVEQLDEVRARCHALEGSQCKHHKQTWDDFRAATQCNSELNSLLIQSDHPQREKVRQTAAKLKAALSKLEDQLRGE